MITLTRVPCWLGTLWWTSFVLVLLLVLFLRGPLKWLGLHSKTTINNLAAVDPSAKSE